MCTYDLLAKCMERADRSACKQNHLAFDALSAFSALSFPHLTLKLAFKRLFNALAHLRRRSIRKGDDKHFLNAAVTA